MQALARYRHRVFVEQLGWPLQAVGEFEYDEFDTDAAVYVANRDGQSQVNAVARLLPSTGPYLLEKVFPHLWGGQDLPQEPEVWELSRFAAVDFEAAGGAGHQASAAHASQFFTRVVEVAREHGARRLVTVSPVGMLRLLRLCGFKAECAGPVARCGGEDIVALHFDLERIGRATRRVQRRVGHLPAYAGAPLQG